MKFNKLREMMVMLGLVSNLEIDYEDALGSTCDEEV